MYCGHCGAMLPDGARFCGLCGAEIEMKQGSSVKKPKKKLAKIVLGFVIVLVLLILAFVGLAHFRIAPFSFWYDDFIGLFQKAESPVTDYNAYQNAENGNEYYGKRSKIETITPIKNSSATRSEQDVLRDLTSRGFQESYAFSEYDMDGHIHEATELSVDGAEKHPVYQAYWMDENLNLWKLYEIDGCMMAYPISFLLNHEMDKTVLVTETAYLISYDSESKSYYKTVPNQEELHMVRVENITAEILNHIDLLSEVMK